MDYASNEVPIGWKPNLFPWKDEDRKRLKSFLRTIAVFFLPKKAKSYKIESIKLNCIDSIDCNNGIVGEVGLLESVRARYK